MRKLTMLIAMVLILSMPSFAQKSGDTKVHSTREERNFITKGNKLYKQQKYSDAAKEYQQALKVNPQSAAAAYNFGLTQLRLAAAPGVKEEDRKKYEEAGKKGMQSVAQLGNARPDLAAKANYNLGNLAFNSEDYQSALNFYKQALRYNPEDNDARRNLRITQKKLKNQNKNQDKQDQKKNQDKKEQEKKDQQKQDNQDKQDQDKEKEQQKQPSPDNQISEQTADQILKAIENKEAQTRARRMNPQKQNQGQRTSKRPW